LLHLPADGDNAAMQTESREADLTKRQRRWFQFSSRTLMIGVTLFCVFGAWFGNQARIVIQRKAIIRNEPVSAMSISENARYMVPGRSDIPWIRRLLGDHDCFAISADQSATDEDLERYRSAFPEADVRRR
jgi:hypothetical protein